MWNFIPIVFYQILIFINKINTINTLFIMCIKSPNWWIIFNTWIFCILNPTSDCFAIYSKSFFSEPPNKHIGFLICTWNCIKCIKSWQSPELLTKCNSFWNFAIKFVTQIMTTKVTSKNNLIDSIIKPFNVNIKIGVFIGIKL